MNNIDDLAGLVDRLPRFELITSPTPLEEYPRLADRLGLKRFFVKRDDLTGLAFGGNKVRELEMFLGSALNQNCDVFIAGGGVAQSNHARQCAAAARRAGMDIHLVLRKGLRANSRTGNLLVTDLLGATIHWVEDNPTLSDRDRLSTKMDALADTMRQVGRRPYVLHSSFQPLGAVGYVRAAIELLRQTEMVGIEEFVLFTTSMGATRIGLELAQFALDAPYVVRAAGWRPVDNELHSRLAKLAADSGALLGIPWNPGSDSFHTIDFGGPEYGIPSELGIAAVRLAAQTEGLLLDPVYSGKGFAGMQSDIEHNFDKNVPVVFLHTGGLPALFAYENDLF
jgi:1-aminocyclopropane-1-carboxylate deaminase/D-cysteine desulfhydrase-like pyridoxal-dependent ACC family enzyme